MSKMPSCTVTSPSLFMLHNHRGLSLLLIRISLLGLGLGFYDSLLFLPLLGFVVPNRTFLFLYFGMVLPPHIFSCTLMISYSLPALHHSCTTSSTNSSLNSPCPISCPYNTFLAYPCTALQLVSFYAKNNMQQTCSNMPTCKIAIPVSLQLTPNPNHRSRMEIH
jgi:hypothetical protein